MGTACSPAYAQMRLPPCSNLIKGHVQNSDAETMSMSWTPNPLTLTYFWGGWKKISCMKRAWMKLHVCDERWVTKCKILYTYFPSYLEISARERFLPFLKYNGSKWCSNCDAHSPKKYIWKIHRHCEQFNVGTTFLFGCFYMKFRVSVVLKSIKSDKLI